MISPGTHLIFVSGLSGSGKTTAMAALEDLAFYCVDNLPPVLIEQFVELCAGSDTPIRKIALALDAREPHFLEAFPTVLERLRSGGATVETFFLDCSNEALENRYRETRRVHPHAPGGTVREGVAKERALLADLAALAEVSIDTSALNVHQLRDLVARHVAGTTRETVVNLVSFGFRHGIPPTSELLFDVRFLPNPHFEPELRPRTGEDGQVAEYVLKNARAEGFFERLGRLLRFLLPLYDTEGKSYLTIAVGCTGGRHRSPAVVAALAAELRAAGREVNVQHRELERG